MSQLLDRTAGSSPAFEVPAGPGVDAPPRQPYRFRVGSIACTVLDDGTFYYRPAQFFANAPSDELALALASHSEPGDLIASPYTCLLIESRSRLVLLDTGGGALAPSVGRLRASLDLAGVTPADVDTVVLTHAHPDHLGGNVDAEGRRVFTSALHVMAADEWAFWSDPEAAARVPPLFREIAERGLRPLAAELELTQGEVEIAPGVTLLPTPGHTPGHLAVVIADHGEELLYISDAALHPIHLDHPAWHPPFDLDPVGAIASKRMLLERAARNHALVHAYHFAPYPCLGHVRTAERAWRWEPIGA